MNTKPIILIFSFLLSHFSAEATSWPLPKTELKELEREFLNSSIHLKAQQTKTDSLKSLINSSPSDTATRIKSMILLSNLYRQNMTDSALHYALESLVEAKRSGDENLNFLASLSYVDAMAASGFFNQATQRYDSLLVMTNRAQSHEINREALIEYYKVGRRIFSNMYRQTEGTGALDSYYKFRHTQCDNELLEFLDKSDPLTAQIEAERLLGQGQFALAKPIIQNILKNNSENSEIYGSSAYQMASVCRSEGEMTKYAMYLAKAAKNDIINNNRENRALTDLAVWLYDQQEFSLAFQYMNYALEEAYKGNERMVMVNIAKWMPKIGEAYRSKIGKSRRTMIWWIVLATLFAIVLAAFTALLYKSKMRNRKDRERMLLNSRLKDTYIGNFISLCSLYSDKYQSLLRLIDRKLSAGQSEDLLKTVRSGKISEAGNNEIYKDIDSVVLALYPGFITDVNSLLRPEERISSPAGQLTPELRIYAFVLLGVEDSARIAKILNYSPNTVYAYRNRMRNKALDRKNFDTRISEIGKK